MIPILFEDENILIVNKPAGLAVHLSEQMFAEDVHPNALGGRAKKREMTLADMLLARYPEIVGVGEPQKVVHAGREMMIPRPGIVHRLDRETSGVMVVAKNQEAFEFLKEQFKNRTTEKIYYAYAYGWLKNDRGTINMPIGRSASDVRMWSAGRGKRGAIREARTDYEVLKRLPESEAAEAKNKGSTEEGKYTFVKLMPKTGRTHQLRVHLKYTNHPIVCDPLYAPLRPPVLGFKRLALHAASLTFKTLNGKTTTVEAPFPEDFIKAETFA